MIIYFIIVIMIVFASSSFRPVSSWKESYASIEQSHNIEGIFVILIFLGHIFRFINLNTPLDALYQIIHNKMDQTVVVMFLFYTGFGMTQSYLNKGSEYIKTLPAKRFFPLLLRYELIVLMYLIMRIVIGEFPDMQTLLISFTGWDGIVNYSWFIFVTLCLYILFGLSFSLTNKFASGNKSLILGASFLTVLSLCFILLLIFPGKRKIWFYDTILIFPFGSWYSIFKRKIDSFLESRIRYAATCFICIGLFVLSIYFKDQNFIIHELLMFSFTAIILLFTMKIRIKSKILEFFEGIAFPMLMLQSLSFVTLYYLNIQSSPHLYIILALAISILISVAFKKASTFLNKKAIHQNSRQPLRTD